MFSRIFPIHAPATTADTGPCGHPSNVSKNVGFRHRLAHLVIKIADFYDETVGLDKSLLLLPCGLWISFLTASTSATVPS